MSHKDTNIEELFRSGLEDFEVPVNDAMWSSVTQAMANSAASTAVGMSGLMKTIIATGAATVIIGTGVLISALYDNKSTNETTETVNNTLIELPVTEGQSTKLNSEHQELVAKIAENKQDETDVVIIKSEKPAQKTVVKVKSTQDNGFKSVAQLFMSPPKKGISSTTYTSTTTPGSSVVEPKDISKPTSTTVLSIEEVKANQIVASIIAAPVGGYAPLEVAFATLTDADVQVLWNFGDGTTSKENKPLHVFEKYGNYTVSLTLTDAKGKTYKDVRTIEVLANSAITNIPTVFTPNNDGQNDFFYITGKNIESFQLMITDIKGNVVYTSNNMEEKWDGKNQYGKLIPTGNYALVIVARGTDGRVYEHTGVVYVKY
jgi:gliding motility-associated-like protein